MIGLDTSVIVRYLVGDDIEQARAARALIDQLTPQEPGFICREVAVEVAWVLERSYRFARSQVAATLLELTASDSLVVEDSDHVAAAAHRYGRGGAGFSDLMILSASRRAGASALYTFDRTLADMAAAVLVEHPTGH